MVSESKEVQIVASLEGERVVVSGGICRIDEYHFKLDRWEPMDCSLWPMAKSAAERWLAGWNRIDRFAALCLLAEPAPHGIARVPPNALT